MLLSTMKALFDEILALPVQAPKLCMSVWVAINCIPLSGVVVDN